MSFFVPNSVDATRFAPIIGSGLLMFSAGCLALMGLSDLSEALRRDHMQAVVAADSASSASVEAKMTELHPPAIRQGIAHPAKAFHLVNHNQTDLDCLSQAIYFESRSEGLDGMRAVGQVVLNRVRHRAFPKTICGVVYQGATLHTGCQFTFTCDGTSMEAHEREAWDRSRQVAKAALEGYVFKPVGEATHYHTLAVHPVWENRMEQVTIIGAHAFFQFHGTESQTLSGMAEVRASTTNDIKAAVQSQAPDQNAILSIQDPAATQSPGPTPGLIAASETTSPLVETVLAKGDTTPQKPAALVTVAHFNLGSDALTSRTSPPQAQADTTVPRPLPATKAASAPAKTVNVQAARAVQADTNGSLIAARPSQIP